jgi:hypothetical protein
MSVAEALKYVQCAEKCVVLAKYRSSPHERDALLDLAEAFVELADEAERWGIQFFFMNCA